MDRLKAWLKATIKAWLADRDAKVKATPSIIDDLVWNNLRKTVLEDKDVDDYVDRFFGEVGTQKELQELAEALKA